MISESPESPSSGDAIDAPDPIPANQTVSFAKRKRKRTSTSILIACIALVVWAIPIVAICTFSGQTPTQVEVIDESQILNPAALTPRLESIRFYEPTKVLVIGIAGGTSKGNLNYRVLEYAQKNKPELLSADERYWADDYFIFVVDPNTREVGTYFGENRAVPLSEQSAIQDAGRADLGDQEWDNGVVKSVVSASKIINLPWYFTFSGMFTIIGLCEIVFCLLLLCNYLIFTRHLLYEEALASWTNVTRDYKITELNASTIPATSSYGAKVLEQFENFSASYHDLARKFLDLGTPSKSYFWSFRNTATLKELRNSAVYLDATDDAISNTTEFLNMGSKWRKAWAIEIAPLKEALKASRKFVDVAALEGAYASRSMGRSYSKLKKSCSQIKKALSVLSQDLKSRKASPEEALDSVSIWMDTLSREATALGEALIAHATSSQMRRASMRRRMYGYSDSDNSHDNPSTILGTSGNYQMIVPVTQLVVGYSQAKGHQPSSSSSFNSSSSSSSYSSSSTSTYSSSGGSSGGFSGSGSSSSF